MINNAKLQSIIIYIHKMDLILYALTFKVERCTTIFKIIIKIKFYSKFKYIAQAIYSQKILYLNKRLAQN
jgi:hypothetical protein